MILLYHFPPGEFIDVFKSDVETLLPHRKLEVIVSRKMSTGSIASVKMRSNAAVQKEMLEIAQTLGMMTMKEIR